LTAVVVRLLAVVIPEPPSHVIANAINTTALQVTWSASNNTDFYQLTCEKCRVNISSNETIYVIGGLKPGTNYTISVAACSYQCSDLVNTTNNTGTSGNTNVSTIHSVNFFFHRSNPANFSLGIDVVFVSFMFLAPFCF